MNPKGFDELSPVGLALAAVAIGRARADWSLAESRVSQVLRSARHLPSRERRRVGEVVWAVIRAWRTVELLAGSHASNEERIAAFLEMGSDDVEESLRRISDPVERSAVRHSLPSWLYRRLLADTGEADTEAFASALSRRAPLCLRANTWRISRDDLRLRLEEEGVQSRLTERAAAGLIIERHPNVSSLASFREGLFEVQDEGSQLIAQFVEASPAQTILDACAGAGGKSLALAAMVPQGCVMASDLDRPRLQRLKERARRARAKNIRIGKPEPADIVLVDAPCSGTGVLARHPAHRWALSPTATDAFPPRQVDLCLGLADFVRPRGRLVYATCSVLRGENEEVVAEFLFRRPEFQKVREMRLWPHRDGTDGFFAVCLTKR